MWFVQLVLLPVSCVAALGYALVLRNRTDRRVQRWWLAAGLVDLWLWLVAVAGPLGPNIWLTMALIFVNGWCAIQVVGDLTGFNLRLGRWRGLGDEGYGRYDPTAGSHNYRPGD